MEGNRVLLKYLGGRKPPTDRTASRQEERKVLDSIGRTGQGILLRKIHPLRDGWVVIVATNDDVTKLHGDRARNELLKLSLEPRRGPAENAKRTLVVFPHDSVFDLSNEALQTAIQRDHPRVRITEVWKNAARNTIKIQCQSPSDAQTLQSSGFSLGQFHCTPHDIQFQEFYNFLECTRCYDIDDHETRNCPHEGQFCSTCADSGHRHDGCPQPQRLGCLNCRHSMGDRVWEGHTARSGACPLRRAVKARYRSRQREQAEREAAPIEDRVVRVISDYLGPNAPNLPPHRHNSSSQHRSNSSAMRRNFSRSSSRGGRQKPPSRSRPTNPPSQLSQPSIDQGHDAILMPPPRPPAAVNVTGNVRKQPSDLMPPPKPQRSPRSAAKKVQDPLSVRPKVPPGAQASGNGPPNIPPNAPPPLSSNRQFPSLPGQGAVHKTHPTQAPQAPPPAPKANPQRPRASPTPLQDRDGQTTCYIGVLLAHCSNIQAPNTFNDFLNSYLANNSLPRQNLPDVSWNSSLILSKLGIPSNLGLSSATHVATTLVPPTSNPGPIPLVVGAAPQASPAPCPKPPQPTTTTSRPTVTEDSSSGAPQASAPAEPEVMGMEAEASSMNKRALSESPTEVNVTTGPSTPARKRVKSRKSKKPAQSSPSLAPPSSCTRSPAGTDAGNPPGPPLTHDTVLIPPTDDTTDTRSTHPRVDSSFPTTPTPVTHTPATEAYPFPPSQSPPSTATFSSQTVPSSLTVPTAATPPPPPPPPPHPTNPTSVPSPPLPTPPAGLKPAAPPTLPSLPPPPHDPNPRPVPPPESPFLPPPKPPLNPPQPQSRPPPSQSETQDRFPIHTDPNLSSQLPSLEPRPPIDYLSLPYMTSDLTTNLCTTSLLERLQTSNPKTPHPTTTHAPFDLDQPSPISTPPPYPAVSTAPVEGERGPDTGVVSRAQGTSSTSSSFSVTWMRDGIPVGRWTTGQPSRPLPTVTPLGSVPEVSPSQEQQVAYQPQQLSQPSPTKSDGTDLSDGSLSDASLIIDEERPQGTPSPVPQPTYLQRHNRLHEDDDTDSYGGSIDNMPSPTYTTRSPFSPKARRKLQRVIQAFTLVAYEGPYEFRASTRPLNIPYVLKQARLRHMALEIQPVETAEASKASIIRLLMDNEVGEDWLYDNPEFNLKVERVDFAEFTMKLQEMSRLRSIGRGLSSTTVASCLLPSPVSPLSPLEQCSLKFVFSDDESSDPTPGTQSVYSSSSI